MLKKFEQFLVKQLLLAFVVTKGASVKGELNFRKMSSVSLAYPFTGFSSPGGFHKCLAELQILAHSCKTHSEPFTFAISVSHNDFRLAQKNIEAVLEWPPQGKIAYRKAACDVQLAECCCLVACESKLPGIRMRWAL